MKYSILFILILVLFNGCASQDQYARSHIKTKIKSHQESQRDLNDIGKNTDWNALANQGIKTYQQVEYEQRIDKQRSDRAYANLMKSTDNRTSRQSGTSVSTNNSSRSLQYNYTKATPAPEKKQLRECVTYKIKSKWIDIDGEVRDPNTANFYKNKSIGSKIGCHYLAKCTLYKVAHKDYTHTVNDRTSHMRINYAVIKQVQQLEESDTCYTSCSEGVCNNPSGVDSWIDSNYYDKSYNGGPSMQQ